jgi:maltose/moltooligosaccharide transporter
MDSALAKPRMTFGQILNMNFGFFGIQYSFGLQQSNMTPIYSFLGADEASIPLLWLAGPMTGLIVQPIIGAMSDKTLHKSGRRTPYFLWGAILCSLMLLVMPFSPAVWFAASVLWILDAANNVTMEPYRAFVSDKLSEDQRSLGFLTQSAFTGFAQTLSYLTPSLLIWLGLSQNLVNSNNIPYSTVIAFLFGAFFSFFSIWWTLRTTKEQPLSEAERQEIMKNPMSVKQVFTDIWVAIKEMPSTMKQLAVMKLFQWYALFCYWQYVVLAIANSLFGGAGKTGAARDEAIRSASLVNGENGAFYNFLAFVGAFALVPIVSKIGPKLAHAICLVLAGIGMWMLPDIRERWMLFIPMIGVGLAWGSIMGNPYTMLAGSLPKERVGVYMGIFNMFIVIPMMIQIFTMKFFVFDWLGQKPENVVKLGGVLMICAAVATLFVKVQSERR